MRSRGSLMSTGNGPRDSESKPSRLAEFISQQTGAQTAAPVAFGETNDAPPIFAARPKKRSAQASVDSAKTPAMATLP